MDDTGASLEVSKAATATRKRRSSILKNQRPPRTPFSELEFNVATPTDTTKSRRVSFSRRTGVAEFVTNEATTTWKNFYEEHNKSLETSGNESAAPRQVIGHLGKRIFDQQFEEIEVVDIGGTLQSNTTDCHKNVNLTLDSINKLTGPIQNFELSLMTDHQTKVFGDELSIPTMNAMSNPININFSNLNTLGDKCDDLEEIERDLERSKNVVRPGPFNGRDTSEYIEIDFNMTHVVGKNDDCDMSITEPIPNPDIHAVSKIDNCNNDKKPNEDWTVDKENMIINPYVTPKESLNFVSNDADDKILVFDGKKLTVQSEREPIPDVEEKNNYLDLLPNATDTTPQRKTIFLNIDDDLPNFVQDPATCVNTEDNVKHATVYNDCDLSITHAVINNVDIQKQNTVVFDDGVDISMTQAIPSKVIINNQERNTIMYGNDNDNNISTTQTVRTNIINNKNDKRRTILYEDDNISFTQAIPANLIMNDKNDTVPDKTLLYENDNDISITLGIPENIIKNIEIDNDNNISMTQAIPSNIIITEQTVYSNGDVNETSAVKNIIGTSESDKRRTVYENDISFTQAIPDVMLDELKNKTESSKAPNRLTIYDHDISMTQAMSSNIIQSLIKSDNLNIMNNEDNQTTPSLPTNLLVDVNQKHKDPTINNSIVEKNIDKITDALKAKTLYDSHNGNVSNLSMTKPIPSDIIELQGEILNKNNKSLKIPNENVVKDNNREVLVYQTNQSVTISKLKDNEPKEIEDKNAAIVHENNEPTDNVKVKSEDIEEDDPDVVNELLVKTESLLVSNKTEIPKNNLNKSILNELLDMSCSSLDDVVDDNIKKISCESTNEMKVCFKNDTVDMLEDEKVSNTSENPECCENNKPIENREINGENELLPQILSKPALVDKEDSEHEYNLDNAKDNSIKNQEKQVSNNRHYETIISSELQQSLDYLKTSENTNKSNLKARKTFKDADDTNELLEMLSDFTDGYTEEPEKPVPVEIKTRLAIENKIEPKRLSLAPNRTAIVLSREDLLNNISMAQAALQKSRFEIDDDSIDETLDALEDVTETDSLKKSMSTEVVKTLQFEEDESLDDENVKSELNVSPLKKTAFGETSYMKECKARVIPTYLKDVSDNIKALMNDLVKPIDVMPFEEGIYDKSLNNSPSTCSIQIQANLLTSSQVDMDVELQSDSGSLHNVNPSEIKSNEIAVIGNRAIAEALRQSLEPIPANASLESHIQKPPDITFTKPTRTSINGPMIVFDHSNPLNNILLSHPDNDKVHKYNPISFTDTAKSQNESTTPDKLDQFEVERVSICYNIKGKSKSALQSGDTCPDITQQNSVISNISKPISIDRSTEGIVLEVKDREVNTIIVMKETKEILEANSSLTLVDDALTRSVFDVDIKTSSDSTDNLKSPVRVIYQMEHEEGSLQKIDSDFISLDDSETDENVKPKKRTYSPTKVDKHKNIAPNVEVTPKPVNKMQKMSHSPRTGEAVSPASPVRKSPKRKISPDKLQSKKNHTTQDYGDKSVTEKVLEAVAISSILDIDSFSQTACGLSCLDFTASYTSSSTKETQDVSSASSKAVSEVGSNVSKINWQPESLNDITCKNLMEECNSSANVVAKIDTLPFMGSRDCEWESSGGDVWVFRLLRSRIRIVIRLAHTHHNASRSRVRADTAVLALSVEPVTCEERDPLARLAVRLACSAMRHTAQGGAACSTAGGAAAACCTAGSVPALLVRCWSQARLALRWARTLRDIRARLALALGDEGDVALKVANIPLRSVWEVRMRIELVLEAGCEAWPRVCSAVAVPLLTDEGAAPSLDRLITPLTNDWGHAPAAIWKIFQYLKNKKRNDDILSLRP